MPDHPRIVELVRDEFSDVPGDTSADQKWMIEAAQDHYLATVAEALEMQELVKLPDYLDAKCAAIGFLRGFRAFIRHKQGRSWPVARGKLS